METWDQETLLRLLVDLKTVLQTAHDFDSLSAGVKALPSAWGIVFEQHTHRRYDSHTPVSVEFGLITFSTPLPARELCRAMNWPRAYASSGDVHQTTWDICSGAQDFPALHWPRDMYESISVGRWSIKARLTGRPRGPLPDVVCGASPAYDLQSYPAEVAYFELLWLELPTHLDFALSALGEFAGGLCEYWARGMEEGPLRVFQADASFVEHAAQSAMEGMHTLTAGDTLTIYSPDDKILWHGVLSDRRKGRLGWTRKVSASDAPAGVAPDTWRQWFQHTPALRAVLRPAHS